MKKIVVTVCAVVMLIASLATCLSGCRTSLDRQIEEAEAATARAMRAADNAKADYNYIMDQYAKYQESQSRLEAAARK